MFTVYTKIYAILYQKEVFTMKLYISSDIEGTCGINHWNETEATKPGDYSQFAKLMTAEVAAACESAIECGASVTVKDAHDTARNIILEELPRGTTLIRGWSKDILSMMSGLNDDKYDAVAFTGYHSEATSDGNPLAHTMTTRLQSVKINGTPASEFVMNAYIAAYYGVPIVFVSGDEALCETAKRMIPDIVTVATKKGKGAATVSPHPADARDEIRAGIKKALSGDISRCKLELPEYFEIEVCYKDFREAYSASFYPGAKLINANTVAFEADDYLDIMRFDKFCM